jgi:hypothetical protein
MKLEQLQETQGKKAGDVIIVGKRVSETKIWKTNLNLDKRGLTSLAWFPTNSERLFQLF